MLKLKRTPLAHLLIAISMLTASVARDACAQTPAAPDRPGAALPDDYKLNMLIRSTLIALNQANQTGNYSVLRDLGATEFKALNSEPRLGEIFTSLRLRNIDLSPILIYEPKLVQKPAIQSDGVLRLTGFFETLPEHIYFDMGFINQHDVWRLAALIVEVKQPVPAAKSREKTAPPNSANPAQPN